MKGGRPAATSHRPAHRTWVEPDTEPCVRPHLPDGPSWGIGARESSGAGRRCDARLRTARDRGRTRRRGVVATAAAVLASQLAIGWVNDAIDAPRDAAVGRTDKPVAMGTLSRRTAAILGAVAAVAVVPLGFLSGVPAGLVATLAVTAALLYDWPLKSTVLSVLPYTVAFACLPSFVLLSAGNDPRHRVDRRGGRAARRRRALRQHASGPRRRRADRGARVAAPPRSAPVRRWPPPFCCWRPPRC